MQVRWIDDAERQKISLPKGGQAWSWEQMSRHNLTFSQVAWHSDGVQLHDSLLPFNMLQCSGGARLHSALCSAPHSLSLHLCCCLILFLTHKPASIIYLPHPKCPLIACSLSSLFQSLSLTLSLSPPPQPKNPLRIHNNGVIDWIKQYDVWWRWCSGEKSMGRCDFLSH